MPQFVAFYIKSYSPLFCRGFLIFFKSFVGSTVFFQMGCFRSFFICFVTHVRSAIFFCRSGCSFCSSRFLFRILSWARLSKSEACKGQQKRKCKNKFFHTSKI